MLRFSMKQGLAVLISVSLALPLPAGAASGGCGDTSGSCNSSSSSSSSSQACDTSACGDNFATSCGNSVGQSIGTAGLYTVAALIVVGVGVGAYFIFRPSRAEKRRQLKEMEPQSLNSDLLPSRASLATDPAI